MTGEIISSVIPDPLLPDYQIPNVPKLAEAATAEGNSIFFGIGLSLAITISISAVLYFRSLYRGRPPKMRPWKKPGATMQAPTAGEGQTEVMQSDGGMELESFEVELELEKEVLVVVPDPYGIGSEEAEGGEDWRETLPDSPYDPASGLS
jgi:hypothetical protein